MTNLSLDAAALEADLEGAQKALGVQLVVTDEQETGPHVRVSTEPAQVLALASFLRAAE